MINRKHRRVFKRHAIKDFYTFLEDTTCNGVFKIELNLLQIPFESCYIFIDNLGYRHRVGKKSYYTPLTKLSSKRIRKYCDKFKVILIQRLVLEEGSNTWSRKVPELFIYAQTYEQAN